jgi:hypothetical protein
MHGRRAVACVISEVRRRTPQAVDLGYLRVTRNVADFADMGVGIVNPWAV